MICRKCGNAHVSNIVCIQCVKLLADVVEEVHSVHADDLCWMDIDKIFVAAGLPVPDRKVGDKKAMKRNCDRFVDVMYSEGKWWSYAELEAALHANLCHPDYSYAIVPAAAGKWAKKNGWERNTEWPAVPGDECWRRKK